MSISVLQAATWYKPADNDSLDISFGSELTPHSHIFVFARCGGSPPALVSAVSDTLGSSYTEHLRTQWGTSPNPTDRYSAVWSAPNNSASPAGCVVSVGLSNSSGYGFFVTILEVFKGPLGGGGVDVAGYANWGGTGITASPSGSGGTIASQPVTTANSDALLIGNLWDANDSLTSSSAPTGWTVVTDGVQNSQTGGAGWVNLLLTKAVSSSGTYSVSVSGAAITDWVLDFVAFE